uniref:Apple domain-containing protein n=1 Tax=Trichuris muris TaxID=70415 RepID=A0A5S6QZU1_TRIMR
MSDLMTAGCAHWYGIEEGVWSGTLLDTTFDKRFDLNNWDRWKPLKNFGAHTLLLSTDHPKIEMVNWLASTVYFFCVLNYGLTIYQCGPNEATVFIRISRARLTGVPLVISSAGDDISCAHFCKHNIEPTTGAPRACASFNYDGQETCHFFDNAATPAGSGILAPNPSANNFYYEKVCLPGINPHQACSFRSHTFERTRSSRLEGFVRRSIQVGSREDCLSACLLEDSFVCRSVNYNYNTFFCEMSDQDRRSKPQYMRKSQNEAMDYFDNNCLSRQNRCGHIGGNLVFIKTSAFEIHKYDHTSSIEAQESQCLQKCLDSLNTFCRSAEFSPTLRKCIISDEDTFSRADQQGPPKLENKDYYEPTCVAADLTSSTCRQQAAFERFMGSAIQGTPVASAVGITVSDCISLCFQNLNCKSVNYVRTKLACYIYGVNRATANMQNNPSTDYYEFNCESEFGGMALCTSEGIRFIVNTREPYTGAIYAADRFATCHKTVSNAKQIVMTFPPPTVSGDCGTVLRDGKLEATVVVSLDGVLPHQVTTEWDRFYKVTCDTSLKGIGEGSVIVTTIYDSGEMEAKQLPVGTPGPVTASLKFLDKMGKPVTETCIGTEILLVATSDQAGPNNMILLDCTATRIGGTGDSVPFKVIENGCPRYPALIGPVVRDLNNNRLAAVMKAFRLDGSYDIRMVCTVMFCAGPYGCPPSHCLDGSSNQMFISNGRKKRSALAEGGPFKGNGTKLEKDGNVGEEIVEEKLTAVLRVYTESEKEEANREQKKDTSILPYVSDFVKVVAHSPEDMMCIAESAFIAVTVSVSLLCIIFSGIIVSWGLSKLRKPRKKPLSDYYSLCPETNVATVPVRRAPF